MKFMKIGSKPDTFYTEEATRTVTSDVPSDLVIQINNTKYLIHKFPLLPKCGLLQRLYAISGDSKEGPIQLHDIPGGEEAFELCAKFCYGIEINLSAHNFVPAFCAAKFLRMTESVEKGNFVVKLEAFFNSCILEGWKDSIITLQTTTKLPEWSESLGIVRRCIDSVVGKILTHPSKITWSYTYTRPGYDQKHHNSIPKDWWTEDISNLDIDLFRFIVTSVRSINMLPTPLIGEALHVYACRWLPDTSKGRPPESSVSQTEDVEKQKCVLETIVSMIPTDRGSVSVGFLLRLLSVAKFLGVSNSTKAELTRRAGSQLEEAKVNDLLIPSCSSLNQQHFYDIDLVGEVLDSFLVRCKQVVTEEGEFQRYARKVAKLIDSYLQVVAKDTNMPASKIISLVESLPDIARPVHDDIYKAINTYLKVHPDLSKAEKKRLCQTLDCRKLSQDACAHAVRNERLPLRTVVQVLYFDQERRANTTSHKLPAPKEALLERIGTRSVTSTEDLSKPMKISEARQPGEAENVARGTMSVPLERMLKSEGGRATEPEKSVVRREKKDREITEKGVSSIKLESTKVSGRKNKSGRSQ